MKVLKPKRRDEQAIRLWRSARETPTCITLPEKRNAVSLRHRLHKARAAEREHIRAIHGPATELDIDQLVTQIEPAPGGAWTLRISRDASLGFHAVREDGTPVDLFEIKDPYAEAEEALGALDPNKPLFG